MTEEKRKLYPAKLAPPPEVVKRFADKEAGKLPDNPILKFFAIFFGEGF